MIKKLIKNEYCVSYKEGNDEIIEIFLNEDTTIVTSDIIFYNINKIGFYTKSKHIILYDNKNLKIATIIKNIKINKIFNKNNTIYR